MIQNKKMGLKNKNHDITQGNNENKRGVVRTMQTKVKEFACSRSVCTAQWSMSGSHKKVSFWIGN